MADRLLEDGRLWSHKSEGYKNAAGEVTLAATMRCVTIPMAFSNPADNPSLSALGTIARPLPWSDMMRSSAADSDVISYVHEGCPFRQALPTYDLLCNTAGLDGNLAYVALCAGVPGAYGVLGISHALPRV